ncbi:MAG: NUDIX hydrolase [Planctomycetota bacterium]
MPYSTVDKRVLFDGKKVRLELHKVEDDNGKRHEREVVAHPGAVLVLGELDDGRILMIKVRRYPVGGEMIWELPAGTLEKGEEPINCAGRELQEETGYLAGKMSPMGWFYTSPGILTERMYCFLATKLQAGEQALEEGEEIDVHALPFEDVMQMIKDGDIVDGKTIAALLRYAQFRRGNA